MICSCNGLRPFLGTLGRAKCDDYITITNHKVDFGSPDLSLHCEPLRLDAERVLNLLNLTIHSYGPYHLYQMPSNIWLELAVVVVLARFAI